MIVLDSSATVDYLLALPPGEWVANQLRDVDLVHAPHVIDIEVLGALRRLFLSGDVSARRAGEALADFRQLRVRRYPLLPFLANIWAMRRNLSTSDAAFVALAEALGLPLVTTDFRLAGAPGLRITVLTP